MNRSALGAAFFTLLVSLSASPAHADNLLQNAGFEEPKIDGKVDSTAGGNPAGLETGSSWTHMQSMDRTKKVTIGLTNAIAHSGKQSIYVQFDGAQKTKQAVLMSQLLAVKAGENYRVSIWGQIDRKRPLTLDQGRPYMLVEVEFYQADEATLAGEVQARTQMIPGAPDHLLFLATKWSEYYATFQAPLDAVFMKVTFSWFSPKHEEEADGIVYFDDAAIEGVPGTAIPTDDPPETPEPTAPTTLTAPEQPVTAPQAPVAQPATPQPPANRSRPQK